LTYAPLESIKQRCINCRTLSDDIIVEYLATLLAEESQESESTIEECVEMLSAYFPSQFQNIPTCHVARFLKNEVVVVETEEREEGEGFLGAFLLF